MLEGLFQPMHLLVIFGIALLVFGPKKLPELGKGIGDGIRGFQIRNGNARTRTTRPRKAPPPRTRTKDKQRFDPSTLKFARSL